MKRILTTIIALWSVCTMAGLPPTTLSGEQATTKPTTFTFEAPNYQGTQISGIKSRVETGNTNLLVNPSFEHSTVTTGWTITNATASADTTNQVEGKKALSLSLTGALDVYQDSTVNAANLVGLQGNASIKIKTSDVDGLKVCARNAGVTSTSLCINIPKDGVWKEINIPNILTATSNGIAITSTGTTGTVKIDDAFVGTSAPFQGVSGAKLVGSVTISGCTSTFNLTSSTFTDFGANTNCVYTTTGSAVADTSFGTTQIPSIKFASLPAGDYSIQVEGSFYQSNTNQNGYLRISDGTNISKETSEFLSSAGGIIVPSINHSISYSTTQSNVTLKLQGASTSSNLSIYANGTLGNSNGASSRHLTFKVYYFPPESKIYSQASQDVAYQPCTFSTLAWQGLGTVTNNLLCARKGQNLLMKGRVTLGTVAASQAQIPLPTNFGTITTASNIPSTSYASGFVLREASSTNTIYSLIQLPSVSYLAMAGQLGNTTINPNSPLNGSAMFSNSDILSIPETAIPIQGWQDYGVIVGSFAGIETCSSPYECTDTFSAQISSAGVKSNENIPWISSISKGGTGVYNITYNTNLKDGVNPLSSVMNCVAIVASTNTETIDVVSSVSTGVTVNIINAASDRPFTIKCQKGTNDYKPKTAKVASSIGVPTVPGITTTGTGNLIDTFSASFAANSSLNSDCTTGSCYVAQIGSGLSAINFVSTGTYNLVANKTYSRLTCIPTFTSNTNQAFPQSINTCSNCNTLTIVAVQRAAGTVGNVFGSVMCQGSY